MNDTYGVLPNQTGNFPHSPDTGILTPSGVSNNSYLGTVLFFMLPFIEQENAYKAMANNHNDSWWCGIGIKTYVSPLDPSNPSNGSALDGSSPRYGISYAPNEWVFDAAQYPSQTTNPIGGGNHTHIPGVNNRPHSPKVNGVPIAPFASIPRSFPDGTSNTLLFAEKYTLCGGSNTSFAAFYWGETDGACNRLGSNAVVLGSMPGIYTIGATFQLQPPVYQCNPCMLQATTAAGELVSMGDGSCRIVNSGISLTTWQRAIMPADGLVLGSDW
jgi:hypothetical protein